MPAVTAPHDAPAIIAFADELRAWREDAGLTKVALAEILGYTDSYLGQIELRKNTPSKEFAEALDTYFKTNAAPRGALIYPRYSWEELGGRFLGLMTHLDPKGEGNSSMSENQQSCSGV